MSNDSRMGARSRHTDESLLQVARGVFLRDGVGATTATVAAAAGVSEALLFKRFGTKDELFQRALALDRPVWEAELRDDAAPPREVLERVALHMIASMREEMPVAMLTWSRNPSEHWDAFPGEPPPVTGLKILSSWFETQMRRGRIRAMDPEIAARVFSGTIVAFSMAEMTGLARHMPLASTTFARGLVDLLWQGLAPTPPT